MKREIESSSALEEWLASASRSTDIVFQAIDLRPYESTLLTLDLRGCVFVGCRMTSALAAHVSKFECINIPPLPGKPFDAFRVALYTPEELLHGFDAEHPETYANTPDAIIYAHYKDPNNNGIDDVLARRIHDFSISDALEDNLAAWSGEGVVGVMGGHAVPRGDPAYVTAALLSRTLAREGYLIVSGGGPGVMEAANLGVYMAPHPDEALDVAIRELMKAPVHDDPHYLVPAFRVRAAFPAPSSRVYRSVGVPTWFYGHEQPNVFATYLAKYFENSVREEGLLAVASRGIIFAEGSAGTLQEIFQSACQIYYRTYRPGPTPMILFGSGYWDPPGDGTAGRAKKVYPLLMKLGLEAGFAHLVKVSDSIDEIATMIRNPPPAPDNRPGN
jgi:predicted Rossmann-fold nucleotide-binding protein